MNNSLHRWHMVSKENCLMCDEACEIFEENFIEYSKEFVEKIDNFQKPREAKFYPIIYKDGTYFGGVSELRRYFISLLGNKI